MCSFTIAVRSELASSLRATTKSSTPFSDPASTTEQTHPTVRIAFPVLPLPLVAEFQKHFGLCVVTELWKIIPTAIEEE